MNIIASVSSISGILTFTIKKEFRAPTSNEARMAAMIAMNVFCENHTNIEMTIALDSEATEPTDKSNPLTDNEIVIPIAIIVTIEMERSILMMLFPWIKVGLEAANTPINTIIVKIVPYLYKKLNMAFEFDDDEPCMLLAPC
jgi:hypothetical protein